MNRHRVLIVIPAWNEAARLAPVVERALRYGPVLVVDDGSSDETALVAEVAGASVLRHAENLGYGQALRSGFRQALEGGYLGVLTLDGDGQHDPDDIPRFLSAFQEDGADLIIGRRDYRLIPIPRRYSVWFGSWLLGKAVRQPVFDNASGFRLYSRRLLKRIDVDTTGSGFELTAEVIGLVVRTGLILSWVEIRTIYGTGKKSNFRPVRDGLRFFRMVWEVYRSRRQEEAPR